MFKCFFCLVCVLENHVFLEKEKFTCICTYYSKFVATSEISVQLDLVVV